MINHRPASFLWFGFCLTYCCRVRLGPVAAAVAGGGGSGGTAAVLPASRIVSNLNQQGINTIARERELPVPGNGRRPKKKKKAAA